MSVQPDAHSTLRGTARERGRAQAGRAQPDTVRRATVGRVEAARSAGWITATMLDYVARQRDFHLRHDPHGMAELAGIAEGYGLDEDELFLHLHLGTLGDLAGGATLDRDGCSAWAVGSGPDGPLLVKNRDFSGTHQGIQALSWHDGPDISTGGMMCLGSLGSPGAYSSGMNAVGLALADTQIGIRLHRVGWLRYFLMTRILATCASVDAALAMISEVPQAGGGSLVMADTTGATAAVELGSDRLAISRGPISWRTNHFLSPELEGATLSRGGGRINANSGARLACLRAELPSRPWDVAGAKALMGRHSDDPRGAPLCQHPGLEDDTHTLSTVVFAIAERCLYWTPGNPCAGDWQRVPLPG